MARLPSFGGAHPLKTTHSNNSSIDTRAEEIESTNNCFPSIGFAMPSQVPSGLTEWWCPPDKEYAFLGFSYEVTACQSAEQLHMDFTNIRKTFKGRYVRLYGACDNVGFYDTVVDAAWDAQIGVHALIWFGWDGSEKWKYRRDALFETLHSNPKAKFVTRVVQFGSEPLFDSVIDPSELADQVLAAERALAGLHIPVTVSEMAYGYQKYMGDGAQKVIDAVDSFDAHMLPFFAAKASTASHAWPLVQEDLNWFIQHGKNKKIYFSENGWPSTTYPGVEPNSPSALADVTNESAYFALLDSHCVDLKRVPGGGVGWFAHIYSDSQESGYGVYDAAGRLKFHFAPRISC